jgi:hypothetical protein
MKRIASVLAVGLLVSLAASLLSAAPKNTSALVWEYIGQVTNTGSDSAQYGNLTNVAGAPSGTFFTFYTSASNISVTVNGPLRIIDRKGTTIIYEASAPGDFSNPDSFRSGTPVQASELSQQVIVNTTTGSFSVVNNNMITSSSSLGGGNEESLGEVGQTIRSILNGQLNTAGVPPPSGWFSGYAEK